MTQQQREAAGLQIANFCLNLLYSLILLISLLNFYCRYYPSLHLANIIAFMMVNELFAMLFRAPSFIDGIPHWLCLTSAIGNAFFSMATAYWLVNIRRLLYLQKLNYESRRLNLHNYTLKHLPCTYCSAACLVAFFIFCTLNRSTYSQPPCVGIKYGNWWNYLAYLAVYIVPSIVAVVGVTFYSIASHRLPDSGFRLSNKQWGNLNFIVFLLAIVSIARILRLTFQGKTWQHISLIFSLFEPIVASFSINLLSYTLSAVDYSRRRQEHSEQSNQDESPAQHAQYMEMINFGRTQRSHLDQPSSDIFTRHSI